MKRSKKTGLSAALALSLLLGLGTQTQAFSDVQESTAARNVAALQMMGVVDGYPDGSFRPQQTLTRAQFCKMVIALMGQEDTALRYRNFTVFPDVKGSHWAAGYINLAVKGETKLLSGYPNGTFAPEETVTFGQAVTILMRLLGYTDADVGMVWPKGFLDTASAIGLTEGLSLRGSDAITRSEAAQLFVNLLLTEQKDGSSPYAKTLGDTYDNVVLLAADATADDGTDGAMETTQGTFLPARTGDYEALCGMRGLLLLNEKQEVLSFLPATSSRDKTFYVAVARAGELVDQQGTSYRIASTTPAYVKGKCSTYGALYAQIRTGMEVTVCFTEGGTASFVTASESVSDVKLVGRYEDVYPNTAAPQRVTVLGCELTVLPEAVESLSKLKIGDTITLLLTQNNQVAAAWKGGSSEKGLSSAGIVTEAQGDSVTVELFCGLTVTGECSGGESKLGCLVQVQSGSSGKLSLREVSGKEVTGDLHVAARTLGSTELSPSVQVYEKVQGSVLRAIALQDLRQSTVSSRAVSTALLDENGQVALLVLEDVTGDGYTYGKLTVTTGGEHGSRFVSVENGSSSVACTTAYACKDGDFGGVIATADGQRAAMVRTLTKLSPKTTIWISDTLVTLDGVRYPIAKDVPCYNTVTKKWVSLDDARAFQGKLNFYYDRSVENGGQIRVIEVV